MVKLSSKVKVRVRVRVMVRNRSRREQDLLGPCALSGLPKRHRCRTKSLLQAKSRETYGGRISPLSLLGSKPHHRQLQVNHLLIRLQVLGRPDCAQAGVMVSTEVDYG